MCVLKNDGECLIIAQALLEKYKKEIGDDIKATIKGKSLIGLDYEPLFDFFADHENAFQILAGEFVTTEDGTGIVHMAPGFGEDDQIVCKQHGIEVVCPVDEAGKFTSQVKDYHDMQVFEANEPIIIDLKKAGKWLKTEQYLHNYPHCWRTDTPLIYKAVPSWYVKVTDIKDKMIKNNQEINWIPHHIKNGMFGKWLENARDWSISRNRYWGCPIPVWESDDPQYPHIEVYGSIAEIEEAFGVKVKDLHRPFIDALIKPNPKDPTGKSKMRRVTDVLDCWFESGSMPYAQAHYPFENKEWFEKNFPADFIVEYTAQTRGWFYTLLVLSSALFDRPPFLNCICHGVLLGDDGQKMSKRLKNYPDPKEVFDTMGADALRWFMISSPVTRGQELIVSAHGIKEAVSSAIKPIWNAFNFFIMYANADKVIAKLEDSSDNIMDRYIIAKCRQTVSIIKTAMDNYDTVIATNEFESFLDVLNNWYIRRSRERFWRSGIDQDKTDAYNTLYYVLENLCRAGAVLMPMILDEIYNVISDGGSLHLRSFPESKEIDTDLIATMDRVQDACKAALHIRNEAGIRVRQPLAKVIFIGVSAKDAFSDELKQLVLDEINVKEWVNLESSEILKYADYKLKINFPILGKRLASKVKDIIAANKNGDWSYQDGKLLIAGEELLAEEFELLLQPKKEFADSIAPLSSNDALVLLDLKITEELRIEGIARDLVRFIQQARKNIDLEITDRIKVYISSHSEQVEKAIAVWQNYIKEQTLCDEIVDNEMNDNANTEQLEIEDHSVNISIIKV